MEVSAINNINTTRSNNTNPAFTGFVDKSVYKFVTTAMREEMDILVKDANSAEVAVDAAKMEKIRELGSGILTGLENFMKKLHDDTSLYIEKHPYKKHTSIFVMKNSNSEDIHFSEWPTRENQILKLGSINVQRFFKNNDLDELSEVVKSLTSKDNPKDIDKEFLTRAYDVTEKYAKKSKGLLRKLILILKANNLEQFAKELGEPHEYKQELLQFRISALKQAKLVKETQKKNNELMNSLLNKTN